MLDGLFSLPWWGYLVALLLLTHATIVSVTLFLHRAQAHRALTLHPLLSHAMRFWLWLTTGIKTREWVAVHRRHHAHCDADEDPHSPQVLGLSQVLWQGVVHYRRAAADTDTLEHFGRGTPDDWLERHLYSRHPWLGVVLMLAVDLLCFGIAGLGIWALQMAWIPFWAAGVVNGLGHWSGYRNFETADASRNLFPLAVLIGGEELHNNHHAAPASARLSCRWYELDIGWVYIRLLSALKLAQVKQSTLLQPPPRALGAGGGNRLQVLSLYGSQVIRPLIKQECRGASRTGRRFLRRARWLMQRESAKLNQAQHLCLESALSQSRQLLTVHHFQGRLRELWQLPGRSSERFQRALQAWCRDARQTDITPLAAFADSLILAQPASPRPEARS